MANVTLIMQFSPLVITNDEERELCNKFTDGGVKDMLAFCR
jgi:hypothetical protein